MEKTAGLQLLMMTLCLAQASCSSWHRIDNSDRQISALETRSEEAIRQQTSAQVVTEMSTQWVDLEPIAGNPDGDAEHHIPPCMLTLNHPGSITLDELTAFISQQCGVPISPTRDAIEFLSARSTSPVASSANNQQASGALPLPEEEQSTSSSASQFAALEGINWRGDSAGLLDAITGRLGLGWRYQQQRIEIFYLDTQNFPILFMDSKASFSSKILSGTTSSSGGSTSENSPSSNAGESNSNSQNDGSTAQSTTMEIKSGLYEDLRNSIKMMLTPQVGRMSLSAGMLTVMDTPPVLAKVRSFVNERNIELNRQVMLNVQVYSVEKQQSDRLGIDWKAVFKDSLGLSFTNAYTEASEAMMSGGVSIIDGKGKGSSAFIKALAQQANVSMLTQASSMTTNLSAVPIQVALQQDYASNASTENTANVGSSSSISKSTITTGFNMTVLPYLIPHTSRMQLQFAINMSDEPTIRKFTSENTSVELMKTRLKTFNQRVIMSSGQTLVLSGYQSMSNTANHQGVGSSHFFALGGGAEGDVNRSTLVILITPVMSE
ncbi:Type IVB pilus formation outer membrane protein [Erwinia sp. Ejp617]|nr:Type IVB pilus formation outer membrane protein [Erwinia sp. Ejp617]